VTQSLLSSKQHTFMDCSVNRKQSDADVAVRRFTQAFSSSPKIQW